MGARQAICHWPFQGPSQKHIVSVCLAAITDTTARKSSLSHSSAGWKPVVRPPLWSSSGEAPLQCSGASRGRRGQGALWGLFYCKGANPIHEVSVPVT